MRLSITNDSQIVADFIRDFGAQAEKLAGYAVISASRKTFADTRRWLVSKTGIQQKRLNRRVFLDTKGGVGSVWAGVSPFPAHYFPPIFPTKPNYRQQQSVAGSSALGRKVVFPGSFTFGKGTIVSRKGKDRFPIEKEYFPLPEGFHSDLAAYMGNRAEETLDQELATRFSRMIPSARAMR